MKKLLATDLDGTLFFPKAKIRLIKPKVLKFIRDFIDKGGEFAIISGRNELFGKKVQKKIKRPIGIIGCNSSFITHDNQKIKEDYFESQKLKDLIDYINKTYRPRFYFLMSDTHNLIVKITKYSIFYYLTYLIYIISQGVYSESVSFSKKAFDGQIDNGKVYKLMILFGISKKSQVKAMKINKELRRKYKDEFEFSWSDGSIEITPSNCSKAEGLKFYSDYLKISHDDVYVVGDSGNDISMFNEFYENSFCMEHASLLVSKYANNIIKHFIDVKKYIEKKEE